MLGSAKRNIVKYISCALLLVGLSVGAQLAFSSIVAAAPGDPGGAASGDASTDDETTCAIDKIGWMLCPLIEKAGQVGDNAFQLLSKNFLETEPELVARFNGKGGDSGTYTAWELARNIANIMFIAAFLIIILSQVTGRGLDNYGIKKLLPRLIIAAIAVNISYYICQLMVDLTNVLGYEIENFLVDTARQVSHSVAMPTANAGATPSGSNDGVLGTMATAILAVAAVVWFLLPVLFLGVSTVVITCLVIIVILLVRKAFIVLLIVLSPIAFVLYLLPNTERYFRKWASMFWQLLLVFPTVSLLFGGGQLASAIVLVAGSNGSVDTAVVDSNGKKTTTKEKQYGDSGDKCIQLPTVDKDGNADGSKAEVKNCADNSTPFMLGLVAAGIAVAPMLAVWAVLKGALSAAGAIGGKIAGQVQSAGNGMNKFTRRPEDFLRKAAMDNAKNSFVANTLEGKLGGGAARFARRRQTANERRDERMKLAQAKHDGVLGKEDAIDALGKKQAISAANKGLYEEFVDKQINDKNFVGSNLGALSSLDSVKKALESQQSQALAEAVKDLEITIDNGDLQSVSREMEKAAVAGNKVAARAYQNVLLKSGSEGLAAFKQGAANVERAGGGGGEMLRENIRANHGAIKDKDKAIDAWAKQFDQNDASLGKTLNDYASGSRAAQTWGSATADEFANFSKQAQRQAVTHLSQQTRNTLRSAAGAQLLGKVDVNLHRFI